ncbi:hypothetical protein SSAG_06768 [Streptomyces sp. Mg1]|nr:hypothetical protein SSAG_06768 [Streptomyces sp. Mg1]
MVSLPEVVGADYTPGNRGQLPAADNDAALPVSAFPPRLRDVWDVPPLRFVPSLTSLGGEL